MNPAATAAAASAARDVPPVIPPEPESIDEAGPSLGFLVDLALKTIYFRGELTAVQLADELRLPYAGVVDKVLEFVKREELAGISGSRGFGERNFQYVVAPKGIDRVREALNRSQYVGPAPVPLDEYTAVVKGQTVARISVDPPRLRDALQHLVITPTVLNRLGPAVNSGRSIFLYGPSGNGKTTIGEAMGRLLVGQVFIPHAIEVSGHIIKVYDALIHKAVADDLITLPGGKRLDRRWVLCRRPLVMAGGELIMESLDLVYEEVAKYYEAPFQMKANGGLFLMDDFGRQQVRPRDLLNRWIVPLEKRVDFLTLHTGKKIEVPFDVLIVFATNIAPRELVDEAFLRRIRHKIEIVNPNLDEFRQIMQRVCASKDVPFSVPGFEHLIQQHYVAAQRELKAVHPRDLIDQIVDIAEYQRIRPEMTKELVDEACGSYFVAL